MRIRTIYWVYSTHSDEPMERGKHKELHGENMSALAETEDPMDSKTKESTHHVKEGDYGMMPLYEDGSVEQIY